MPGARVAQALGQVRDDRYALLSNVRGHTQSSVPVDLLEQPEEVRTVVIPPGAWAVGRSVDEILGRGAAVVFTGIRRHGILGKAPQGSTRLREGDLVLIVAGPKCSNTPKACCWRGNRTAGPSNSWRIHPETHADPFPAEA